jgi:uncharacterized membrane protein YtjA (UPF0391 family)
MRRNEVTRDSSGDAQFGFVNGAKSPFRISNVNARRRKEFSMLHYAIVFLVIALIAAVLGFGGIAGAATGIAKILFLVFLVLFVVSLVMGRRGPRV